MSTYKDAGVDIDAGDRAVELMKASIAKATRAEVMGGIGGFAGLFDASALKKMNKPLFMLKESKLMSHFLALRVQIILIRIELYTENRNAFNAYKTYALKCFHFKGVVRQ